MVTRKTLVERVVAAGRDPRTTPVGELAEAANWTIDPELPLDEAFGLLEEWDAERVPVVDGGRLVGVLSRSVLQRRLAEDEPPAELEAELAAGVGAGRRVALDGLGQLRGRERRAVQHVALADLEPLKPVAVEHSQTIKAPPTITGARSGSRPGSSRRSASGREASRSSCRSAAARESW